MFSQTNLSPYKATDRQGRDIDMSGISFRNPRDINVSDIWHGDLSVGAIGTSKIPTKSRLSGSILLHKTQSL